MLGHIVSDYPPSDEGDFDASDLNAQQIVRGLRLLAVGAANRELHHTLAALEAAITTCETEQLSRVIRFTPSTPVGGVRH